MTLVEILVAMVMTLIVLGAMMVAFRYASEEIAKGRAMIELSNQLRMAQETIRVDLEGATVDMRPWSITASPNGYFEYIEGPQRDRTAAPTGLGVDGILGDFDDILALTVRGNGQEFKGRYNGGNLTSQTAEVIWWTDFNDRQDINFPGNVPGYDESIQVYRRQLLIRPDINPIPVANWEGVFQFFLTNDVSMRVVLDGTGTPVQLVANSLEDLAKRENRFCHWTQGGPNRYPYPISRRPKTDYPVKGSLQWCQQSIENYEILFPSDPLVRRFAGGDIMISDVLAFDIKVFSRNVPIDLIDDVAVAPSDTAFSGSNAGDRGAFVDVGFAGVPFDPSEPEFSTLPVRNVAPVAWQRFGDIWVDTFSTHYESNGIDDDLDGLIDQATDGLDNDSANGVDDNEERETMPPYPFRIQGVEVTFRIVERSTQQVRQTSVVHSFMPR